MMLLFRLGRPGLLPVDDLGVRKGAQRMDRLERPPTPAELLTRGERWSPYRSDVAFYLRKIADFSDAAMPPTPRSQE